MFTREIATVAQTIYQLVTTVPEMLACNDKQWRLKGPSGEHCLKIIRVIK